MELSSPKSNFNSILLNEIHQQSRYLFEKSKDTEILPHHCLLIDGNNCISEEQL